MPEIRIIVSDTVTAAASYAGKLAGIPASKVYAQVLEWTYYTCGLNTFVECAAELAAQAEAQAENPDNAPAPF